MYCKRYCNLYWNSYGTRTWSKGLAFLSEYPPYQFIGLFAVQSNVHWFVQYTVHSTVRSPNTVLFNSLYRDVQIAGWLASSLSKTHLSANVYYNEQCIVYCTILCNVLCTFSLQRRVLITGYSSFHFQYSREYSVLYTIHDQGTRKGSFPRVTGWPLWFLCTGKCTVH